MTKKQLALEIIERLKKEYPDADCTLDYDQAWKLLVSVRLAAQCTDARVNVVVEKLYQKFPDVDALAQAPVEQIEEIVRPCGLGNSKARDISACMRVLRDEYGGKASGAAGSGEKERKPDHGGCVREACHCHGHPLYPPGEPDGACGRHQGACQGGEGSLENHSSQGGKRFLPQACGTRQGGLHGKDKALLRQVLPAGCV